ncbi:hypothetical protein LZ30DRAFT_699501 [Colletotrichum cereale]|nr:hypothetical protein LZ30DRAFT_699501 [Colletotrichum cereale]
MGTACATFQGTTPVPELRTENHPEPRLPTRRRPAIEANNPPKLLPPWTGARGPCLHAGGRPACQSTQRPRAMERRPLAGVADP